MLDHLAPTMDYGCPDPVNTCIIRYLSAQLELKCSQANMPLAISVANLTTTPRLLALQTLAAFEVFSSLVLSFFSVSLAHNTLVTVLIITKIVIVYREISPGRVEYTKGLRRGIVPILIESGMMTFTAQLLQTLMFRYDGTAYPIIVRLAVMLFVRDVTLNCQC